VIAHEYFHNWSGNRVTCRDWFQLSLKEGFTVLRDQLFSEDMGSAAVKRIEEVRVLRSVQFPEDSGPLAHPIRRTAIARSAISTPQPCTTRAPKSFA
jgi:aminopeptidase N